MPGIAVYVAAAPAVDATQRAEALDVAREAVEADGGVLVSTCHRVELLTDPSRSSAGPERKLLRAGAMLLEGRSAARHVIDLALGLESLVVGEDQVLHQFRTAVAEARTRGPLGMDLELLVDAALRAGRLGRSWRPTGGAPRDRSLADVAVSWIEASTRPVSGRRILVVGAGTMGRAAAVAAAGRGARVSVASRTAVHATTVAEAVGGVTASMDAAADLAMADAVIVALSGPWPMGTASVEALIGRPIVVDLSMPPAVPDGARHGLGDRFVDIDRLARWQRADTGIDAETGRYRSRLERLAERTLASYLAGLDDRARSSAQVLAEAVERQRTAELDAWLRRRPDLHPDARRHLDELTRDLAARLFREPLARLARDPDGRRRRALDELFGG